MPLPTIATPTYELEIPSIKKVIKYRPFLVKEEKILILAMESEDTKQIASAVKEVITNCIKSKGIKVEDLSTFDIEYLFLNIRGKSVGETVDVLITCPDDGTTQVPSSINLDDIKVKVDPEHSRDIKLDENLSLRMKYPSLDEFIKANFGLEESITVDDTFDLICSCIEQVYTEEESWAARDCTKKELSEFVESLTSNQFKDVEKFFDTMPKLSHTIKIKNPNTKVESEVVLEGLTAFFA
jgi:citrate lyase gamma subunit